MSLLFNVGGQDLTLSNNSHAETLLSQVTCRTCGKETRLQEQYMHLSLELSAEADVALVRPQHVNQLLAASLQVIVLC